MSAPFQLVAWRGPSGFGKRHIERTEYPYNLLCPAVPPSNRWGRVTRWAFARGEDVCTNCLRRYQRLARNE